MTRLTRLLASFLVLIGLAQAPAQGQDFGPPQAEALTETIVEEMLVFIDSDMSLEGKVSEFQKLLLKRADMPTIARFTLGVTWRTTSEAQQTAYKAAFDGYIANKYGRQFTRFDNQTIDIVSSFDAGRRGIVVMTEFDQKDGSEPIRVEWQYSDRSGSPKLVDLIVEGVSLLSSERQEIGAKLERYNGNVDRLIEDLENTSLRAS
ncbi:MAG: ABC transporter substrate-binding protein [Pseudomonadota bacterium]